MPAPDLLARARRLLARGPLVDGHNDLLWIVRDRVGSDGDPAAYDLRRPTPGRTDLDRLVRGCVGAQFWAVFVPCEAGGPGRYAREQIALARSLFRAYPEAFAEARTVDGVERAVAEGRIACLLGIEGGHALEGSLDVLRAAAAEGVRYLGLTHDCTTDWADAARGEARHGGLAPFGVEVVREMNRLGVLVDLSHAAPATMHAALDASRAPVIWSHAAARALVDHPRNVPDDVLHRLPSNGGVVMVTFVPAFVRAGRMAWEVAEHAERTRLGALHGAGSPAAESGLEAWRRDRPMPRATLADVADHVEHVRVVAGADHVGVGSDFDGFTGAVEGLEDVSRFPALFAELLRRGWSDQDLAKLAGGNVLRALRRAEEVARETGGG